MQCFLAIKVNSYLSVWQQPPILIYQCAKFHLTCCSESKKNIVQKSHIEITRVKVLFIQFDLEYTRCSSKKWHKVCAIYSGWAQLATAVEC